MSTSLRKSCSFGLPYMSFMNVYLFLFFFFFFLGGGGRRHSSLLSIPNKFMFIIYVYVVYKE